MNNEPLVFNIIPKLGTSFKGAIGLDSQFKFLVLPNVLTYDRIEHQLYFFQQGMGGRSRRYDLRSWWWKQFVLDPISSMIKVTETTATDTVSSTWTLDDPTSFPTLTKLEGADGKEGWNKEFNVVKRNVCFIFYDCFIFNDCFISNDCIYV